MADNLMTVEQFNEEVRRWAVRVRSFSAADVATGSEGTGNLAIRLSEYVDPKEQNKAAYKVAFRFPRYGVFRAYGAGRGYKIEGGVPVKTGQPNKYRGYKLRKPLDWIDHNIEEEKDNLANSVQAFYGDKVLQNMLRVFDKAKIKK